MYYSNEENHYYIKISAFISLELLGIFLFYELKKYIKYLENIIFFMDIFFIIFLDYLGMIYLEILTTIIMLTELPLLLYSFILFLVKEKNFYFFYTMLNLVLFGVFLTLNTYNFVINPLFLKPLELIFMFIYVIIIFLYLILINDGKKDNIIGE
ncbi:MAG: hypothetical protein SOY60_10350 [Fusobacterium gastrosuis]|nr:hypothetical protein [Fusobacterium gastrosuis]